MNRYIGQENSMQALCNPCEVPKPSAIAVETQELEKAIADLHDAVQKLTAKLEPVLRPLGPKDSKANEQECEPMLPPLGMLLRGHRRKVSDLAMHLRELTRAVEL